MNQDIDALAKRLQSDEIGGWITPATGKEAAAALRAQQAEIEALRRFADLYTVKMPQSSGICVNDLKPPYIWNGTPVQTSKP